MIVKMQRLALLCVKSEASKALEKLRDLGCVHIDTASRSSEEFAAAATADAEAEEALRHIAKAQKEIETMPASGYATAREVNEAAQRREALLQDADFCARELKKYAPFGEIDLEEVARLAQKGLPTTLVKTAAGTSPSHCSAVNLRWSPGAILAAIIAASMGKVPDPQKGSARILPDFQKLSFTRAAASVSLMGASTLATL